MKMSSDLIQKFNEAKSGNLDAINYFLQYFMRNVEKQLNNLNLTIAEKDLKINNCQEIILKNFHVCYDVSNFIEQTFDDIKNAIYLNQVVNLNGSKSIIVAQKDIIRAKISNANLDLLNISVKDRELARLYYLENKTIEELAAMFKCSKTIIYVKLRRVANILVTKKASSYIEKEQSFLYRK